jgi:hypothetical protein
MLFTPFQSSYKYVFNQNNHHGLGQGLGARNGGEKRMKTSVLLAIFAVGAVVAFAGLAVAAGPSAGTLGAQDKDGSGHGMMTRDGGCHGSDGQTAQYQYRYDGECPCDCQAELRNNYSWSYGEGNMTCESVACQTQYHNQGVECPGTCDNYYDWNHSWSWDYDHCGG